MLILILLWSKTLAAYPSNSSDRPGDSYIAEGGSTGLWFRLHKDCIRQELILVEKQRSIQEGLVIIMSKFYMGNLSIHRKRENRRCPKCGGQLKVVTKQKHISTPQGGGLNSSPSMKVYDTRFACHTCRLSYSEQDLIRLEKKSNS